MKKYEPYRRPPRTIQGTREDILSFIKTHGIVDKDTVAKTATEYRRTLQKQKRERLTRFVLDLHGLSSNEAEVRIVAGLDLCKNKGIREVLLIHGRGLHSGVGERPVLKNLVQTMLEGKLRGMVKRYRPGVPAEGGEGVTVLFLS
jgi:DNA-nicking Smr family endonuclease